MYLMSTQGNIQIHSYSSQGMRRFTPTAAHPPWSGVLQAISYGPACPQQFPRQLDNVTAQQETMTRCRVSRVSRVTCHVSHHHRQYWQHLTRVRDSISHQAEDCLYLNIFRSR